MQLPLLEPHQTTPARPPSTPLNIAHRGASAQVPENTLTAVRRAIELGADVVEIDVHRTEDEALVVLHDPALTRTTDARAVYPTRDPWRVADFTYDELLRLDAGSWKSAAFAGERIPLLSDVVALTAAAGVGLLVEVKTPGEYPGIASDLLAALDGSSRVVVQSFGFAAMKELKALAPDLPVGLLGAPAAVNLPALATWAAQINPHHLAVDRGYVDRVHELGMQCMVWTVNRGPGMKRALRLGVDGVITNRPCLLGRIRRA